MQFIRHSRTGQVREKLSRFDAHPLRAICKYLIGGFVANKDEWYISSQYPSHERATVTGIYCYGLIVVQERGESIPVGTERVNHPLWQHMLSMKGSVPAALTQFARFGSVVKLVDMGRGDLGTEIFR